MRAVAVHHGQRPLRFAGRRNTAARLLHDSLRIGRSRDLFALSRIIGQSFFNTKYRRTPKDTKGGFAPFVPFRVLRAFVLKKEVSTTSFRAVELSSTAQGDG
jgi:hypothetical protein